MAEEQTTDIIDLLKKPMDDFPDLPSLPPQKWFYGKLIGVTAGHSSKKETPLYNFEIRITEPGKDVTPAELNAIESEGFTLADYKAAANMYLTPNSLRMLRTFLSSLGFPTNVSFFENLRLDESGLPTQDTQDLIRGKDVTFRTPARGDNGRVYLGNVEQIQGVDPR